MELSSDLPEPKDLYRWLGEPVDVLVIRADLFVMNRNNYPVLSRAHQIVVQQFLNIGSNLALKANTHDTAVLSNYIDYLHHLINKFQDHVDPIIGYDKLTKTTATEIYNELNVCV